MKVRILLVIQNLPGQIAAFHPDFGKVSDLQRDALLPAEDEQLPVGPADVQEDLVDRGPHPAVRQEIFQIVPEEVGHADDAHLPRRLGVFQGPPDGLIFLKVPLFHPKFRPGLGRVNDHLVQIVQSHFLQSFVNGAGGGFVGFQFCRHLAGHEQFLPGQAAGTDAFPHAPLVAIGLGGVNKAVAQLHGGADGFRRLVVVNEPGAKAQFGNGHAVCKGICFVEDHHGFLLFFTVPRCTAATPRRCRTAPRC